MSTDVNNARATLEITQVAKGADSMIELALKGDNFAARITAATHPLAQGLFSPCNR